MYAHAADLICGAFFFAMKSCEYCLTAAPGRTKMITLSGILFHSKSNKKLAPLNPNLAQKANFLHLLTRRMARKWIQGPSVRPGTLNYAPSSAGPLFSSISIRLNPFMLDPPAQEDPRYLFTMTLSGISLGLFAPILVAIRGFGPLDIQNKSIRSGAAMAHFLMSHSMAKIMILGRWSSSAFLVYIRPQVLEWTTCPRI
jgi:hypothetical protein